MYDSLTLFVPVDDPARTVSSLADVEERYIQRTGEVILTGRCRGLYVKTSGSGVTVNGSLSRYWFGSNVMAPTFNDCRDALLRLEEALGSSVATMRVFRIDVAATLSLKYPCTRYLRMFGNLSRFKRFERNGGLLYKTQRRELDFYDKKAEARSRKETLPKCFNGRHALRYELRHRQQLKERFGGEVTAEWLMKPDFFRTLIGHWEAVYQAIHKQERGLAWELDATNSKNFGASLERFALEKLGGEIAVLEELRVRREFGEIDRLTHSRLRERVKRLCRGNANRTGEASSPISELGKAVALEAERLRNFE